MECEKGARGMEENDDLESEGVVKKDFGEEESFGEEEDEGSAQNNGRTSVNFRSICAFYHATCTRTGHLVRPFL